jgi:hypothetical protein
MPVTTAAAKLPLDDLAARFCAATLPLTQLTHEAHLRVGAWHVARFGASEALLRLRTAIRRLNDAHGGANTATSGYHETITAAYVTLIAAFLDSCDASEPLAARVERLLASPLADRTVLLRFWSRDALMSSEARATWVAPDQAPLQLTKLASGPRGGP